MMQIGITLLTALYVALGAGSLPATPAPPPGPSAHPCAQRVFAGSRMPLQLPRGATVALLGPGRIAGADLSVPAQLPAAGETLIVATRGGSASARSVTLLPAPALNGTLATVDADCGITLYTRKSLTPLGTFVTADSPADAIYDRGKLLWAAAAGTSATRYDPAAGLTALRHAPDTAALLADPAAHVVAQASRDLPPSGDGALTLYGDDPSAAPHRLSVGETPEGLALSGDTAGSILVTATNAGTLMEVDARTARVTRTLHVGPRPFGVAVDAARGLAFVALNAITAMRPSPAGGVVAVDIHRWHTRAVRHAAGLALGVAVDPARRRVFVTEELGTVLVLDEELHTVHPALHPCELPWLPSIDFANQRLFVPCPRENRVAVYDLRTLRETARMTTTAYPLRVVLP
ncbi:hypothetical protein EPN52_10300 [bacterium]|nr:MAG: hypothetical protein EPN52_10300 [bacterium]